MSFWTYPEFTTEENRVICQRGTLEAICRSAGFVFISQSRQDEFDSIFPGLRDRREIVSIVALLASRFPNIEDYRSEVPPGGWLAVGSLEPRKNYGTLLAALERYWERSKVRRPLIIAGGAGWKSEEIHRTVQALVRRGLVLYEGYVSEERLKQLYRDAFALIFPSHYEGFGLPIIEAMSQACPVITRRNSTLQEVGGSAAIYYDDSVDDLVECMLDIENSAHLCQERSRLSLTQARKFHWSVTAQHVLELYHRLLKL
jgi:glycosyltransferase involved in cell wall biosynthesis